MINLIITAITLTIALVAVFIVFGLVLGIIERETSKILFKSFGEKSIIITGLIGTTIHELGHYIMCKLFLHKVSGIKLFSLKIKDDNTLGYVNHSYNKKSPYQRVGNFFIGIGPIIFGTIVILILYRVLLPHSWDSMTSNLNFGVPNGFKLNDFVENIFKNSLVIIKSLITTENLLSIKFWVFLILIFSISNHMDLSPADIKNSIDGLIFIFIISFIICLVLFVLGIKLSELNYYIATYNILITTFLLFALIFSIISYIIAKLISIVKK